MHSPAGIAGIVKHLQKHKVEIVGVALDPNIAEPWVMGDVVMSYFVEKGGR